MQVLFTIDVRTKDDMDREKNVLKIERNILKICEKRSVACSIEKKVCKQFSPYSYLEVQFNPGQHVNIAHRPSCDMNQKSPVIEDVRVRTSVCTLSLCFFFGQWSACV